MPTSSDPARAMDLDKLSVRFDPMTMISKLHVRYRLNAPWNVVLDLVDPASWHLQPFFLNSQWVDGTKIDPKTHAADGVFFEQLDFRMGRDLLRNVENYLSIQFSGFDPDQSEEEAQIVAVFNLRSSVDHLLTVDRGFFSATSSRRPWTTWQLEIKKEVRFDDALNSLQAPLLLSCWQEATYTKAIDRAVKAKDRKAAGVGR